MQGEPNFLLPFFRLIDALITIYFWIVIGRVIMSWLLAFNVVNTSNQLVFTIGNFLHRITEPALRPIRRFVPTFGGVDVTPIVLILIILFVRMVLAEVYVSLATASY